MQHAKLRMIVALALLAVVLACSCASAGNIYFPSNSRFSDDDLLIYGDGDPVYMTRREWREIYGLHDITHKAGAPFRRWASQAAAHAGRRVSAAQQALLTETTSIRAVASVPEPGMPALLMLFVLCRRFYCRPNE